MEKEEDKAYMAHIESGGDFKFRPPSNDAEEARGGWGGCDHGPKRLGPSGKEVKAHHLLVLLLRLRQICCHPGLIKSMIDSDARSVAGTVDEGRKGDGDEEDEDDLVSQLADMSLSNGTSDKDDEVKSVLNMDNPVFQVGRLKDLEWS